MDLSNFLAEMFVPGMLTMLSLAIPTLEFRLFSFDLIDLINKTSIFSALYFIIFSYLLGMTTRHLVILKRPSYYYCISIHRYWRLLARKLVGDMKNAFKFQGIGNSYYPRLSMPEDENENFSPEQSQELISCLRDSILASREAHLSDYLMYQWNVARLARNSHLPLLLLSLSCLVGAIHRTMNYEIWSALCYTFGVLTSLALAIGMQKVYKERLSWHVDILMRAAAMELKQTLHNNDQPKILLNSTTRSEDRSLSKRFF